MALPWFWRDGSEQFLCKFWKHVPHPGSPPVNPVADSLNVRSPAVSSLLLQAEQESPQKIRAAKGYAVDYLQMLVIVCHSFPSRDNLTRLESFLAEGDQRPALHVGGFSNAWLLVGRHCRICRLRVWTRLFTGAIPM